MWKRRPFNGLFCWPRYLNGRDACLRPRPRRGGGLREQDGVDCASDRRRIGQSAELSSDRVRDRTNGADPVSRVEPTRPSRGLYREPAGLPGAQVTRDPQDRSQRRARASAFGPHRLLQARAREVFVGPRDPLADQRAQEAGWPASDLGKSDPRPRGRVRGPTAPRAHRRLYRQCSQSKRWDRRSVCRHAGSDCGADCGNDGGRRDRRRHQAHDDGVGSLPTAHDDPRRRPTAAIDDPSRIRRSRDVGAYLGLVPRRYQSGEVDYTGGISKCGDRRVRTLLYEAANVMLTRYKGQLKLKDWAFAIAKRSTMRKARVALARRLEIIMHAMLRDGTEFASA